MSIQIVRADQTENRIYMAENGNYRTEEVIRNSARILLNADRMRPGFGVIVYVSSLWEITSQIANMNTIVFKYLVQLGMSRCIVVTPIIFNCTTAAKDCFFGVEVEVVKSLSEAARLLDEA